MFRNDFGDGKGIFLLTVASVALTVPFIFIMKDMANSLKTMANQKTGLARIKRYR